MLIPALCLLLLLVTIIPSSASEEKWRPPYSIPGYPPRFSLDPRPPKGAEWSWIDRAEGIRTVALMGFTDEWKGRKPIFNYYLVSECPDEDTNEVYRREVSRAIDKITRYRDKFVEMYPQFGYLMKLKLQLSDGPLNDSVFNIPIYIPKNCIEVGYSYGSWFREIGLLTPTATFHEMVHTLGSGHLRYGSDQYYSFRTVWGPIRDIGDNTLSWYALALAWSWLRFYDAHPGLVREDFAAKSQVNLKYKADVETLKSGSG